MKNTKKILFVAIVSVGMTSSVFASWWNPMSWRFFSKQDKQVIQEKVVVVATSTKKDTVIQDDSFEALGFKEQVTQPKNSKTAVKYTQKQPVVKRENVVEKDFKNDLLSLYDQKIKFIKVKILLRGAAGSGGGSLAIKNAKEDIDFFEKNRRADDSQDFKEVNVKAVAFWKTLIEERQKIINYEDSIISTEKQILQKLEKEKSDIDSKVFVSETEYKLRANNLNTLIDEENFEKEYSEQDKNVSNIIGYQNDTNEKFNKLMISISERDLANVQQELVTIRADIETSKANSAYYNSLAETLRIEREQKQIQPTSVSCETSYSKGIGYPSTHCTEFPTMKTMTCDTNYNVGGNAIKNCYFK